MNGFDNFLAELLPGKQAVKRCTIFLSHLIVAFELPGETESPEIVSFHFNAACCFVNKYKKHTTMPLGHN